MAKQTKTKTPEETISLILRRLRKHYPNAGCHLNYSNAFELLIATILAAQCTDARVNMVTPALFEKYPTAKEFARANEKVLQKEIRSTGFFRNKAKAIMGCSKTIVDKHGGHVPETMDELSSLPGVGRKTANVILGNVFGQPAIVVDTHLQRVSQRLGLTKEKDPTKIEIELQPKIPKKRWTEFSHQIGDHGRNICAARKPDCERCFLAAVCRFYLTGL